MTTICAWCKRVLKQDELSARVSHGICKACMEKLKKSEGNDLDKRVKETEL